MPRDHLMGYAPAAEPSYLVDVEGDYYEQQDFFGCTDPWTLGYPSSRRQMRKQEHKDFEARAARIGDFNNGDHMPAHDVLERSALAFAAERRARELPAPAVTPEPETAVVSLRVPRPVALLLKPVTEEELRDERDANVKRWDLLHAASERRHQIAALLAKRAGEHLKDIHALPVGNAVVSYGASTPDPVQVQALADLYRHMQQADCEAVPVGPAVCYSGFLTSAPPDEPLF